MILADTNVWIDHIRADDPKLARLLGTFDIATHP